MTNATHLKFSNRDMTIMDQLEICQRECLAQNHSGATVPSDLVAMVTEATTNYRVHYEDLQTTRSVFKDANRLVRDLESQLRSRLRRAFQGIRHHKATLQQSSTSVESFGLAADGTYPEALKSMREPLQIAKNLLNAHALVEAAGNNCLFDPTAAELQQRVDALEEAWENRKQARDDERAALQQMRETRNTAKRILRTVRYYINAMTIGVDEVTKRQILRGYGFRFEPSKPIASDADVIEDETPQPTDSQTDNDPAVSEPEEPNEGQSETPIAA